ncbi:hypothetical protein [Chitinophaga deserti]|uniref:hypothetical protein n=1 Tax=Chitinophaga deserti TaxID=2164099 RepID=UPI000D6BE43C|nr:hypothetical protein [Chitinophaga deserti]
MTIDLNVTTILEQISRAKNNIEVEAVIRESVNNMTTMNNGTIVQRCLGKLEMALERIPPIECSSEQWSAYRFALICIRTKAACI